MANFKDDLTRNKKEEDFKFHQEIFNSLSKNQQCKIFD